MGDALAVVQLSQAGIDLGEKDELLDRIIERCIGGQGLEGFEDSLSGCLRSTHSDISLALSMAQSGPSLQQLSAEHVHIPRFVMVQEPEEAEPTHRQIIYIPDFFDELKAKMAEAGQ